MTKVTDEIQLAFIETIKNYPFVASRFNIFESHGQKDFLFTYDDHEADIALDATALPDKDLIFEKVHFEQKSVSAEVLISKKLINSTSLDVVEVAKNSLNPRFLRKIQAQAFGQGNVDGLGDEQFQDIFQYNNYENKIEDIATFTEFGAMYDDFVSKSENLNGAVLVVNNPSVARSLKDTAGNAVFKGHISADGTIGTVEGIPVRVQNMNGKGLAVLMREDAYAVSVNQKSLELDIIVDDTELAKKSAISVYGIVMASGMVVNPSAIKILTVGAQANTNAPVEVENPVETDNVTSGIDPEIDAKVKAILMKDIEEELKAQGINEKPTSIEILPMDDNLKPKTTKTRKAKGE